MLDGRFGIDKLNGGDGDDYLEARNVMLTSLAGGKGNDIYEISVT